MKPALQSVGLVCLCLLAWLTYDLISAVESTTRSTNQLSTHADSLIVDADQSIKDIRSLVKSYDQSLGPTRLNSISRATEKAIGNVAVTAAQVEKVSLKEEKYWDAYPAQISAVIASTNDFVKHTDDSINKDVLPATAAALKATATTANAATESLTKTTDDLAPSLKAFADLMSNPAFKQTATNLSTASASLVDASDNTAKITALGVKEMQQLTAPVTKARAIIMTVLSGLGHLLGL